MTLGEFAAHASALEALAAAAERAEARISAVMDAMAAERG